MRMFTTEMEMLSIVKEAPNNPMREKTATLHIFLLAFRSFTTRNVELCWPGDRGAMYFGKIWK